MGQHILTAALSRREREKASCAMILVGIREEELLSLDAKIGDGLLPLVGGQPIDERPSLLRFHMGMLGRIDQNGTILIEQACVPCHQQSELPLILKADPGAAVADGIAVQTTGRVQSGAHTRADLAVPGATSLLDIDSSRLPEAQFQLVCAAVIAA
jgi:hypothetical protein